MAIISASYKTDIPAFYGQWFMNRIDAGYCKMMNYYSKASKYVSLEPKDVDGIVFWTKDASPFMKSLNKLAIWHYPYIIHYTINNYPKYLEPAVPPAEMSVSNMRRLSKYGGRVVVWRYDPIIFTEEMTPAFHISNFGSLASKLAGSTDEVVVSFLQEYESTKRRTLGIVSEQVDVKHELLSNLASVAKDYGMKLSICSQEEFVNKDIHKASCVDIARLSDVAGKPIIGKKRGNRPGCMCYESIDIGDYNTCLHGCTYCYATRNMFLANKNMREHNVDSEFLCEGNYEILRGVKSDSGG
jgi:hypothetical protein